ncbi:hypothetical protein DPMN_072042 [Dreissena polymorpha]|uniref:Uncharacterized protein n=1 Tax=Dreissena polymorpha TaxID=45954 RepID=A0A9D3Z829_DREPO|nr:hypothetical protein DPMN_072042 [Dreissena polymorpha]
MCSPFILNATLMKHLSTNTKNGASAIILQDLYVNNIISSFENEEDMIHFFHNWRKLIGNAGMTLRSWTSNSINLKEVVTSGCIEEKNTDVKVLGMLWNTTECSSTADVNAPWRQSMRYIFLTQALFHNFL